MAVRPKPRVVAIVQARMGSTRLPGKVLRPIAGQPLLWHVVHRVRRARTLDAIAIATTTDPRDEAIVQFGRDENLAVIRGSEDNVLSRFALAAREMRADVIVRVSSDAPFIDADFVDHLVEALINQDGDYVMVEPSVLCAHEGVDPFSRRALDKLLAEGAEDPVAREHVTGYFKLHPDFARIVYAKPYAPLARESARLTVDTPDDLAFIDALYSRMAAKTGEASLADLLLLLEREPALKSINAHVRQKRLDKRNGLALIRCDGGSQLGFGHVKRSLMLARALRDREGFGVVCALHGEEKALVPFKEAGFETILLPSRNTAQAFASLAAERHPDVVICDARENITRDNLHRLASRIPVVAVIDDSSDRRLAATHAYYPPMPQLNGLSWSGSRCQVRVGWEWAVLGFDPAKFVREIEPKAKPLIVVSMGGSDPFDLTRLTARALNEVNTPFTARFVIGPGFRGPLALSREIEALDPRFTAVHDVAELGAEFASTDLAVVAFGVTGYELAALGVPALYLAISEDHRRSAEAFEAAGIGETLGMARTVRPEQIACAVWTLLNDAPRRRDMRIAGLAKLDGQGASRIAADLAAAVAAAHTSAAAAS